MNLRAKVLLLATLPLLVVIAAITTLVNYQSKALSAKEIEAFEAAMVAAKKAELLNYVSLALTSIDHIYNAGEPETPDSEARAKALVKRVLNRLTYGRDGYFFVYDYQGRNLVHPKQPWRVGNDYIDLTDPQGRKVIQGLIEQAKAGGGYFHYTWEQPSTGEESEKIGYAVGLNRWGWMLGTGIYLDDVAAQVARAQSETRARIRDTFLVILGITVAAILAVFGTGLWVNARETQLADARLGQLTDRIVAAQEDERARVSRDLHDGISQILVATKLALERARLMLSRPAGGPSSSMAHDDIARADTTLDLAIREVRRISHDLRPGVLDDLGLGEALNDLAANFEAQFGIACDVERADMPERLPAAIETTLYRIAQEALTNVERHAQARLVMLRLSVTKRAGGPVVTLWVIDDGIGFAEPPTVEVSETRRGVPRVASGMGLRNMEKRLEPFGGRLIVQSRSTGTRIGAELPLRQQVHAAKPPASARRDAGASNATDRAKPTETPAPSESQTS